MESKQSSLLLQKSIKDNTEELHDFLADLKGWEKEIKEVDHKLSNNKDKKTSAEVRQQSENLPLHELSSFPEYSRVFQCIPVCSRIFQ